MLAGAGFKPARMGDHKKALSLLDESLAISTELGMRPLMERVAALQERAASLPAKAPAYPGGLTEREVEVLRLVAVGKTDREIAEQLFISGRTVSTHVSNILNKDWRSQPDGGRDVCRPPRPELVHSSPWSQPQSLPKTLPKTSPRLIDRAILRADVRQTRPTT